MALLTFTAATFSQANAGSINLLMFEEDYCSWCEKWNEEIGGIYHLTPQACYADIKRVQITDPLPESLGLAEPVSYTPTFVLVYQDREIGRITGYPREDFFWPMLDEIIESLPSEALEHADMNCQRS